MQKVLVSLMAFALAAGAADVTGTWVGRVDVGNGGSDPTIPWSITLKQTGSELTGTAGDASHQFPIEKAEINGNSITFQVTAGAVLTFKLRQEGDVMKGTAKIVHEDGTVHEGPASLRRKQHSLGPKS
jgi:hypothetical protein